MAEAFRQLRDAARGKEINVTTGTTVRFAKQEKFPSHFFCNCFSREMAGYGTLPSNDDSSERSQSKSQAIQVELSLRRLKRHPYAWHAKIAIGTAMVN